MQKKIIIFLLIIICCIFVLNALYWFPNTIDDTFISLRYAYNLINGKGLVWNEGERVAGFSNFLWTILNAVVLFIGLDLIHTLKILGIIFSIGTLLITYLSARELIKKETLALVPPLLLAVNPYFCSWATEGMETPLFSFLIILTYYLFYKEIQNGDTFPYSGIIAGLTALCRIDFFIYLFPLAVFYMVSCGFRIRKYVLYFMCIFFSMYLAYVLFHFLYYGKILPNTYYAKMPKYLSNAPGLIYVALFVFPVFSRVFLIGNCAGWLLLITAIIENRRNRLIIFFVFPLFMAIFYAIYVNGDWMPNFRFFVPVVPFILILIGKGFEELTSLKASVKPILLIPLLLLLVCSSLDIASIQYVYTRENPRTYVRRKGLSNFYQPQYYINTNIGLEEAAFYTIENVRPQEKLGLADIGITGFCCPEVYVLDLRGLTNREIARFWNENPEKERFEKIADFIFLNTLPEHLIIKNSLMEKDKRYTELYKIETEITLQPFKFTSLRRKGIEPFYRDDDYNKIIVDRYERIQKLLPGWLDVYPRLIDFLVKQGKEEKAQEYLMRFAAKAQYHKVKRFYYFNTIIPKMLESGMKEEAKNYIYKISEWSFGNEWYGANLAHQVGVYLLNIYNDVPSAEKVMKKSLESDPQFALTLSLLGEIKERQGDIILAEKYHKKALELAKEHERWLVLQRYARFLVRQQRLVDAYETYLQLKDIKGGALDSHDATIFNQISERLKRNSSK